MSLILDGSNGLSDVDGSAATPAIRGTDTNTGIFFPAADTIAFSEGGTEVARFNSSGNLQTLGTIGVGNATPSTSGAGITFPATQSASTDANTLDDYEEGTWTPVDNSGAGLTFLYSGASRYIKIGKLVFVTIYITFPTTASSAQVSILGLPFTTAGSETYSYMSGRAGSLNTPAAQINTTSTFFTVFINGNSAISNSQLSGSYLILSGCYVTA
jgi:hypothetical protein